MFYASVIANVLDIFDGSLTPPFVIIASHTVSLRVSDRSVALAASYSSVITTDPPALVMYILPMYIL